MAKTFLDAINRAEQGNGPVITVPDGPVTLVDTASAQTLTNKTMTSPVVNAPQGSIAYERLITTRVLVAADSGKTFGLALANGFTVTLPALASGLFFKFVVEIAPTTAYIIASAEGDNMAGQVFASNGADADSETDFTADQINFVASASVIGDQADVVSVGTAGWAAKAFTDVSTGITFTG